MSNKNKVRNELLEISRSTNFQDPDQTYKYAEFLKDKFDGSFTGFVHNITQENKTFTRARINDDINSLYSRISQLWYPNIVKKVGRANFINKPVFYCSNYPGTTIFEINPQVGQLITTLEVKILKSELKLIYLGFNSKNTPSFNNISEYDQGIHEFMEIIFREKVNVGEEYNYLKTAIIADLFLKLGDGIAFPSVGSKCKGWNIVFTTEFIDNHSQINKATVHEVIKKQSSHNLRIKCLHKSTQLINNNLFLWKKINNCETHLINENIYH